MQRAFSLVELSIVLVILGLLTGGILAGQSLIRAAELRSVTTEFNRWVTATQTFRDKYMGLPGDITNATKFWGAEPAANCPGDETTPSTTTATCNGNGDGSIVWIVPSVSGESHRYWQQLANAGLIEGTYTGTHTAGACSFGGPGNCNVLLGVNIPRSKFPNAGWSINDWGTIGTGHAWAFAGSYRNSLMFGRVNSWTNAAVLKTEEAWNIDTKMDDGRPGLGNVRTQNNDVCVTSTDPALANYALTVTTASCQFFFTPGF